jgi:predicted TIM-barrel fold metal-dependent hydrolase
MPPSGWDCHAHVIGDPVRFPMWAGRSYTPSMAPLEAYLALLDRRGLAHGALIQPSIYGFDNRCLIDALDRAGGRLAGIAVPPPDASPRDLEAMHEHGVRGVRCNLINPGGLSPQVVAGWQPVLRALGWHVEVQVTIGGMPSPAAFAASFGVPIVFDHMGRPWPGRIDLASSSIGELIALVRDDKCYVKLSAPYRLSATAAPWDDVTPLARALVSANPRACLWGSDWPHVDIASPVRPDDVFEALEAWCPDPAVKSIVLTEAPMRLYGSGASDPRSR